MKLIDTVERLYDFSDDQTIYAAEPWTQDCDAIVAIEASGAPGVTSHGMRHFREISVAKEVLRHWPKRSRQQRCDRLIRYAQTDA